MVGTSVPVPGILSHISYPTWVASGGFSRLPAHLQVITLVTAGQVCHNVREVSFLALWAPGASLTLWCLADGCYDNMSKGSKFQDSKIKCPGTGTYPWTNIVLEL